MLIGRSDKMKVGDEEKTGFSIDKFRGTKKAFMELLTTTIKRFPDNSQVEVKMKMEFIEKKKLT